MTIKFQVNEVRFTLGFCIVFGGILSLLNLV